MSLIWGGCVQARGHAVQLIEHRHKRRLDLGVDGVGDGRLKLAEFARKVDADVVERKLSVVVNGEDRGTTSFPAETTSFGELSFGDSENVVLTLVDMDDAGNSSSPAVAEFVATDTLPPVQPGEFGVTLVREE